MAYEFDLAAVSSGKARLTDEQAISLLEKGDLLTLASAANEVRRRLVPGDDVTFIVDRNINYTNVCISECRFCAFFTNASSEKAYVLAREELSEKVAETLRLGGTAILLQGGMHPDLKIEWYESMLAAIKDDHPSIHIHGFGPPEVMHIAKLSGISTREVLTRLHAAGLDSLPGGGAEILVDRVRQHVSPKKATSNQWLNIMREAHELGISTTATMMFGAIETIPERIEHLRRIRELQDDAVAAGRVGFRAFIPWSFQPGNTALAADEQDKHGVTLEAASGWDYLRTLAVSRLYLDNVRNIQASWVTQGAKIGQVALAFGANDMGSTMIEENVVAATGTRFMLARDELIRLVRDAGFTPVQRDTVYREVKRY